MFSEYTTTQLREEIDRREALRPPAPPLAVLAARLVRKAAKFYGIEPSLVIGKGQTNFAANCRWAVWETLRVSGYTSPQELGTVFERHASAISNCWEKMEERKISDPKLSECLTLLTPP